MFNTSITIDLGTSNIIIYSGISKDIILNEPTIMAIDKKTLNVKAIGREAKKMIGRTHQNIIIIQPIKEGVISEFTYAELLLKHFIKEALGKRSLKKPTVYISRPSILTKVENRAIIKATKSAGASKVVLVDSTLASAIGAGIDIRKPIGSMIVDIGGGTTDISVISLGQTVISTSVKMAGDNFNQEIIKYLKKKYDISIGEITAEQLKIQVGTGYKLPNEIFVDVKGKNTLNGLPKTISVSSHDIYDALKDSFLIITNAVHSVMEHMPPELASDLHRRGLIITGGSALLSGIDKIIQERVGLTTIIADDPFNCVAIGASRYHEFLEEDTLDNIPVHFKMFLNQKPTEAN